MNKVKWLLVGAGDIANSRVGPALCEAADSELVAICARSKGRVDTLAASLKVDTVYHDFEQALAETDADAVYIATPHHLHVEMSLKALTAGKHILCEKPLGINGAECLRLLDAVRESDRITCCSNYRLFTNQFKTTHEMIRNNEIGELVGGWAHDEEPYYNPGNTPYLKELGMSPVLCYGFYLINLALILFGMPSEVFAMMSSFNCDDKPDYDIDDLENILLRYPDGQQFSIVINNTANAPLRHSYQFYGSKGRIYWPECPPHFNTPIRKLTRQDGCQELPESFSGDNPGVQPNWHLPMVEDFVKSVQTGTQPVCTIESAVKTAVITDAILKSAASGRLEPVIWDNER
jgi:predicted dehydrogenase